MSHTLGPWIVVSRNGYLTIRKQFGEHHHMDICNAVHGYMYQQEKYGNTEEDNQMANANLIAAAPEMLEALEAADRLLTWMESGNVSKEPEPKPIRRQIEMAINKAKGN